MEKIKVINNKNKVKKELKHGNVFENLPVHSSLPQLAVLPFYFSHFVEDSSSMA